MKYLLTKLKELSDFIIRIDQGLGLKKFSAYLILILCIVIITNFKNIVRETMEIVSEVNTERHDEGLQRRDELLRDLYVLLGDLRVELDADRVLYFEYHNSKENLIGIPFKYADLILQSNSYGVYNIPEAEFRDINTGSIVTLYNDLMHKRLVSSEDTNFCMNYPGAFELFKDDGSDIQVFVGIPGVDQPIGLLVFEWVGEDKKIDYKQLSRVLHGKRAYLSRINGLIMSKMK
jgi:hypothetical protein